ncbi:ABC transporter substrate-binding protein [Ancylobacter dichloromethanicus]|uniref:Amino acid ABC transporter n=1 Tax=Ancylobacter dichloromethanicus TaxID=518825 RepID=A0A9W6J5X5_9HYPH|nr:ABC transporter substrate-binding protein [Ancylobacter dichloromethanicus]MBS7553003.1 ABC transporter substrate-binding protein [Ancylobacter dichloromethanicus]GLK70323.1 amino acid ABC transporter [Ancylobacter dichloromethanicus]
MSLVTRIAAAALLVAAMAGSASAKEWKTVRIGTEGAYPPFNYIENGELKGFDIDIAKALCAKMKVECTFTAQDWDGIIPALLAGKYDAIVASMSITEERQQQINFSKKYYNTPATFVVPKDSPITETSPEALKGKVLGAQGSTIHSNYLEDVYAKAGAEVKLYGKQDEANLDLANGRLDAVLADKVVLLEWLGTDEGKCCKFTGAEYKDPKYFGEGVGVGIRKDDTDLVAMFNKAIDEIVADGTYKTINDKYFPFSVY